jgi:heme oxygenase (biliverdin-IX-beta and delta-forming)
MYRQRRVRVQAIRLGGGGREQRAVPPCRVRTGRGEWDRARVATAAPVATVDDVSALSSTSQALELIRSTTAPVHQTLERALAIGRADADEGAYVRHLEALLGWLEPLEALLWSGGWPESVTPATRSGKIAWIEADLRARGRSERELAALPRQRALPPLGSLSQRFGVAYVVEGAQLGSRALLQRLGPRLAPLPVRWLQGYGSDSADRWRSFVAALCASLADQAQARSAAQSARATFALAHAWFVRRGVA